MVGRTQRKAVAAVAAMIITTSAHICAAGPANADPTAYLVNVTVRPGYNFVNADQALAYGHGICDKIASGVTFRRLVDDIKVDFNTTDGFQATYLISQSAQELCPEQIWQLRNSAAGYTG